MIKDPIKVLVIQHAVEAFSAFLQLYSSNFLSFQVKFLEFLKSQMQNTNAGLIKSFVSQFSLEYIWKLTDLWQDVHLANENLV